MGREDEGLPDPMEALSRVHIHLLSASCVPGPVADTDSKGMTEKWVLRAVRGVVSRISLFLNSRLQQKRLIQGPTARDEQSQDPNHGRRPLLLSHPSAGTDHAAVTALLSSPVSTPKDRPLAHTGGT